MIINKEIYDLADVIEDELVLNGWTTIINDYTYNKIYNLCKRFLPCEQLNKADYNDISEQVGEVINRVKQATRL